MNIPLQSLTEAVDSPTDRVRGPHIKLIEKWSQKPDSKEARGRGHHLLSLIESEREAAGLPKLDFGSKRNIARLLENAEYEYLARRSNGGMSVSEATYQGDIAYNFIQLPVIAAVLPSLEANRVAIVQALERRSGSVFYLDVNVDRTKGEVAADSKLIDAKNGHARAKSARQYASGRVFGEVFTADATGSEKTWTTAAKPIIAGTVSVLVASNATPPVVTTITDDGEGALSDGGTVVYSTGVVTLNANVTQHYAVTVNYCMDMGVYNSGIGAVKFHLYSEDIKAEDFKLRADYELGAAVDLEKAHGVVLQSEITKYLGNEVKFATDQRVFDDIATASMNASAALGQTGIPTWDAKTAATQEWVLRKYAFENRLIYGSNAIFKKTLRGVASYIICGLDIYRLLLQLTPKFVEAKVDFKNLGGPFFGGTWGNMEVIVNPFFDDNFYVMGLKGDGVLYGGYLLAPYIPLVSTPALTTADAHTQQGFYSASGFKVLNNGLFTFGTVTNIGIDAA